MEKRDVQVLSSPYTTIDQKRHVARLWPLIQESVSPISVQKTGEADRAGENSSFIFTVCIKSVPFYHFKLACVLLHMAVKKFFGTTF